MAPGSRHGDKRPRLERWSWTAQLVQVVIGTLAFAVTVMAVLLVVWQLRESSIVTWRTYLDERGSALSDRAQENAAAACLFGYPLSPNDPGPLELDCKQVVFKSVEDARAHLLYAEQWLDYLREVDSFDYIAAPVRLQKRSGQVFAWLGFDALTSELGSWHAGLRRALADDPSGAVSFILVRWRCWREDGDLDAQVRCAEAKARGLGLCRPHDGYKGQDDFLNRAISLRCADANSFPECTANVAETLGVCTKPDESCLCSGRLREKSEKFTKSLKESFPSGPDNMSRS